MWYEYVLYVTLGCVWMDGWWKQPHLARATLTGLWGCEAAHLLYIEQSIPTGLHNSPLG